MTGDTRKRTLGLVAILVVSALAGFLAAAGTSGAEYATVGTVSESQAFQMPAEEDQRVRFALEANQDTATEPTASFALYDPSDAFFTEFELGGDGDDAEAILDQPGHWVLFVTEQQNAEIAIQYEDEQAADVELEQVPVEEQRTTVAEQDGGSLDEQVAFRLDARPATVFLEYTGDIQNLDATVATDEGPVYELSDASANTTEEGTTRSGDAQLTSANLAAGTYEVDASADAFAGELVFVQQTYERQDVALAEQDAEEPEANVSTDTEVAQGTLVAELEEGQAYEIDTATAQAITFVAERETRAKLMVYNDSDRLVDEVELEHEHDYDREDWWDEDNGSEDASNVSAKTLDLADSGSYVVYAKDIDHGDEEIVQAFVPAEAADADSLEVERQEATLEGNEDSWNTTLDGALVGISAWTRDAATTDRNVTAVGEAGPVLAYEQEFNTFGAAMHHEHEVYPENFTAGELEVTMDADGLGGETSVELVNYVR